MHAYTHTYINTYAHTCIQIHVYSYIHTYKHACIHTYVHSMDPKFAKMIAGCGISHQHTKHKKYAKQTEIMQYKYYVMTSYRVLFIYRVKEQCI